MISLISPQLSSLADFSSFRSIEDVLCRYSDNDGSDDSSGVVTRAVSVNYNENSVSCISPSVAESNLPGTSLSLLKNISAWSGKDILHPPASKLSLSLNNGVSYEGPLTSLKFRYTHPITLTKVVPSFLTAGSEDTIIIISVGISLSSESDVAAGGLEKIMMEVTIIFAGLVALFLVLRGFLNLLCHVSLDQT